MVIGNWVWFLIMVAKVGEKVVRTVAKVMGTLCDYLSSPVWLLLYYCFDLDNTKLV
jgi:hypothetical protein